MNEDLPPSLTRFAAALERALRRELGLDRPGGARRGLRAHPRCWPGPPSAWPAPGPRSRSR